VSPSLVCVWLGGLEFPYQSQVVREVRPQLLADWREEFVLTLAHELHHVETYWHVGIEDDHAAEVAAERHGVRVLNAYRDELGRLSSRAA